MEFTHLELLYLRHLVVSNVDIVQHQLNKYKRYAEGGHFDGVYEEKIALAETEMNCLHSLREKISYEISLQTFFK